MAFTTRNEVATTKMNSFHPKERLLIKEFDSTKGMFSSNKNGFGLNLKETELRLKEMAFTIRNVLVPLEETAFTERNGFDYKQWSPIKGFSYIKKNCIH